MSLISVIMPSYNAEQYVAQAIESVLAQSFVNFELIIVDDGSTDDSLSILRNYASQDPRIHVLSRANTGISGALNDALAVTRGEYLCRLDADDWYPPDRLEWQSDWLRGHPEYEAVTGSFAATDPTGKIRAPVNCGPRAADITSELREVFTHLCAAMMRTTVARKLNGFRRDLVTAEDTDFQFRLAKCGRIWYEPRVAYYYRLHDESIIHTLNQSVRDLYERRARGQEAEGINGDAPKAVPSAPQSAADHLKSLLIGASWRELDHGRRRVAIGHAFNACRITPWRYATWSNLIKIGVKAAFLSGPRTTA